jgi:hypothetical protein
MEYLMAKPVKMISPEAEVKSEASVMKKKMYKSKVNMVLPSGVELISGQHCDVSQEDLKHLQSAHGESIANILE